MPRKSATLTRAEVAELMGVPVATARSRLTRAGIVGRPGRDESGRMVARYPREAVERLIREGFRAPGRPRKD